MKTAVLLPICFGLLMVVCGCAGNGAGLDENGNPIGNGGNGLPVAFDPTFTNIQQNIFTAICISCHSGAFAPQGLRLEEGQAYNNIVNQPSTERTDLRIVEPGNPDASYIVRKLEGGPDILGSQMPLGLSPLPQNVINSVRVWIAMGAPQN